MVFLVREKFFGIILGYIRLGGFMVVKKGFIFVLVSVVFERFLWIRSFFSSLFRCLGGLYREGVFEVFF